MHSIQKQIVNLSIPEGSDSVQWQNRLEHLCREQLTSALEQLFDLLAPSNELLEIDQLDIEINMDQHSTSDDQLIGNIKAQLQEKIEGIISHHQLLYTKENKKKQPANKNPSGQTSFRTFLHFLQTGTLPWWYNPDQPAQSIEDLTIHFINLPMSNEQLTLLRSTLKNDNAKGRLLHQFDKSFVLELFIRLIPLSEVVIRSFFNVLEKKKATKQSQSDVINFLEKCIKIAQNAHYQSENILLKLLTIAWLECDLSASPSEVYRELQQVKCVPEWLEGIKKIIESEQSPLQEIKVNHLKYRSDSDTEEKKELQEENNISGAINEMYIQNAGLVLLAPFLSVFFDKCQLIEGKKLKDKPRTVQLLHYLTTGISNTPEYQLVLNKVLCGMPLLQTMQRKFEPTSNEKEHATKLLQSVIRHWSVLKKTSIDGLRSSFLLREGKLTKETANWRLTVEQKSYDMLLDSLPWTLSIVKTPWMDKSIWVEWN